MKTNKRLWVQNNCINLLNGNTLSLFKIIPKITISFLKKIGDSKLNISKNEKSHLHFAFTVDDHI